MRCLDRVFALLVLLLVVVGDITGNGGLGFVFEVLTEIRDAVGAHVLVVPGNHDIYLSFHEKGEKVNSLLKLSMFNDLVENIGCYALMKHRSSWGTWVS
ncbi:MAG: hypothetical protein DRJ38_10655 [Thermoprotei archaeon]|nr:MAG: hypothetical protein DRJ38_10655 [Thermoprotei archaeon]